MEAKTNENILCYKDKLLPLWQYNASLCRKATFDVAHPVGEWSVFLWLAFREISDKSVRLKAPMSIWTIPFVLIKFKSRTFSDVEIRLNLIYLRQYVFIEFFFKDCSFPSSICISLFYFVLIVKPKTYCTKNQIKELQHKMLRGIYFYNIIFSNPYLVCFELAVIIKTKNILLELPNLRTSCRDIIYIKTHEPLVFRNVAIFQSESVFYKLIIENGKLIVYVFMIEIGRFELIISEENSNFCFSGIEQIKGKIHNGFISFKSVCIYFLPFYFFIYTKTLNKLFQSTDCVIIIDAVKQYSSVEIREIRTFLVAFVKPNIYHNLNLNKISATDSDYDKVTLRSPNAEADLISLCESVTNHNANVQK